MSKIKCLNCGEEINSEVSVCPYCNKPLSQAKSEETLQESKIKEVKKILEDTIYNKFRTYTFKRSILFGIGATIISGLLWFGLIILTNMELGLIALAVGWLVDLLYFWEGGRVRKPR